MNNNIDYHLLYSSIIQLNLDGLIEKNGSFNFRCPLCGDSDKSLHKKRGYIIGTTAPRFYCHNCNKAMTYLDFCKEVSYPVWKDLISQIRKNDVEFYDRERVTHVTIKKQTIARKLTDCYVDLLSLSEMEDNPIKEYVQNRNIPDKHFNNMFYFKGNPYKYFDDTFHSVKYKDKAEKRIEYEGVLVPMINKDKNNVGFSIRVVGHPTMRFINLTESVDPLFFGEDDCNFNSPIIIVEGLFDKLSFTSPQVLAMQTADPKLSYIKDIAKNKIIYVFDNEYNNYQINRNINKCIDAKVNVFIWDDYQNDVKDMNDLMIKIKDEKKVIEYILKNTYNGYEAVLMLDNKIKSNYNIKNVWA